VIGVAGPYPTESGCELPPSQRPHSKHQPQVSLPRGSAHPVAHYLDFAPASRSTTWNPTDKLSRWPGTPAAAVNRCHMFVGAPGGVWLPGLVHRNIATVGVCRAQRQLLLRVPRRCPFENADQTLIERQRATGRLTAVNRPPPSQRRSVSAVPPCIGCWPRRATASDPRAPAVN
jgi:hypothetical protein